MKKNQKHTEVKMKKTVPCETQQTYTGWVSEVTERIASLAATLFSPPPSHYVLLLSHRFHYEPRGQSHDWENSRQSRRERLKKEWEAEKEKDSGLDGTEGRWKLSNRTWKQSRARWRRRREDEGGKTKECEPWKVNVETADSGRII